MFENLTKFFKKFNKKDDKANANSKDAAKERLHLVLMQDRANVSADFLELMKQEIIEVIKKYIDVDEEAIDVRLTNKENDDGTNGAPALYANIPILNIKNDVRKMDSKETVKNEKEERKEVEDNKNKKVKEKFIEKEKQKIKENKKDDKKEEQKDNEENIKDIKKDNEEENRKDHKKEEQKDNNEKENKDDKNIMENSKNDKEIIDIRDENAKEKIKSKK